MVMAWRIVVLVPELKWEKKRTRAAMRAAGGELARITRRLIRTGPKTGRIYYLSKERGGPKRYRASAPGEAPAAPTGKLADNVFIRVYRDGMGVEVREKRRYAWILEHGRNSPYRKPYRKVRGKKIKVGTAIRLAPRPSLSRALDARRVSITKRIHESVALDLKFVRGSSKL